MEDLGLVEVQGRLNTLCWCGRCGRLVLLELLYLTQEVVNHVVSVCESNSIVLYLLLKLLRLLLHVLDLQVLCGLELLKLMGLNLGGLLCRLQKDTVLK
jgi:hypothetical protein